MKILICIPCLLVGGTEVQTLNLVEALCGAGHSVTVACYFEFTESVVRRFEKTGCKVVCFSKTGERIFGWKSIVFLFHNLRYVVKRVQPDVAHVQYMTPGAIPIVLLKLLRVKTVLATAHTSADIYPSLKLVHFIQKRCVKAFTCITKLAEESFFGTSQLYTPQTQLKKRNHFTIYNALPSCISIRDKKKAFSEHLTLGVVSRLERIKGMDLVIPAFEKVNKQYPETRLLIVGDGSLREMMHKQAIELGVEDSIDWLGRQGQDTIEKCYDKVDILLMPSRSEGFGLTAIEGMARGAVLVAANVGGLPEVVADREVGLLHDPENVEDIAQNINSLVTNRQMLQQYSDRAIEYVRRFDHKNYTDNFLDLYSKL
ncbi:MAG: glycosyltransferase family 4 protein [Rikenellaceae bacterium]